VQSSLLSETAEKLIPSGLLCVYKPKGYSSSDAVTKVRIALQKRAQEVLKLRKCVIKVGHGGTLDPMAEGLLVIGVGGDATKLMGDFLAGKKSYQAVALLGTETDTLDGTGVVTETMDCSHVTLDKLEAALPAFRGDIVQTPPMYSALNLNGKRLYELAREGVVVERKSRNVTIYDVQLTSTRLDQQHFQEPIVLPSFGLQVQCSGGTYVRTLIADIARSCESRAHMTALVRTHQGPFSLQDCLPQSEWNFDAIIACLQKCTLKAELGPMRPAINEEANRKNVL